MKKIILVLFMLIITLVPINAKALSVDKNNLTMENGKNEIIDLYVETESNVKEVNFSMIYTSYDIPAYFNVESGLTDEVSGIKHRIVFSEPVSGKIKIGSIRIDVVNNPKVNSGSVNIHTGYALTPEGENVYLNNQVINVTVNNQTTEENTTPNTQTTTDPEPETPEEEPKKEEQKKNLLEKIESELVDIKIKEDVFEYKINVKEDIEELDLKPITKDEKYKVEITTQKISDLIDNTITITIKDGEYKEEYKIKVNTLEEIEKVEIDEEEFESTYKYKGKWTTLIIVMIAVLFVGLFLTKKK